MINANSRNRLNRLNIRQRKKLRVGEFQELGFAVQARLVGDEASCDAFLNAWLEVVDQHEISFGGHFSAGELDGVVFPVGRAKIDAALRELLGGWLKARAEVAELQLGELRDVWHGGW